MRLFLPIFFILCLIWNINAQWTTKNASLVTQRHHPVTFTVGGNAYLVSGTTGQSNPLGTDNFYRYNKEADSWTELTRFPGGPRAYAYAGVHNDKAYFGFGSNDNITFFKDLWEFDPATEEWTRLSDCGCIGRTHPAFVVHDGKIYVGLGGSLVGDLNDWWEYDIASDEWTQRPSLPGPPRHHPFHFSAGDYVYAGFGHQGNNYYADWYRYDTSSNTWTQMNNHPGGPRVAGQEFSHNGYGYVISGDGNNHFNLEEGEFWKYEHLEDTWSRLPNHPGNPPDGRVGRWAPGLFVLDNHVYFFGGVNRGGGLLFGDMYSYELEAPSGNKEQVATSISVFPNPASGIIRLNTNEIPAHSTLSIQIYDAAGKMVKAESATNQQISVSDLADGMYIMNISSSENKNYTAKFMVIN